MKYSAYIAKVRRMVVEHADELRLEIQSARQSLESETITEIAFHLFHLRGSIPDGWVAKAWHIADLLAVPKAFVEGQKTSSVEKIYEEWKNENQN